MNRFNLKEKMEVQRARYPEGGFDLKTRIKVLEEIKSWIIANEDEIYEALFLDLKKGRTEAYLTEIGIVLEEIDRMTRWLWLWSRRRRVRSGVGLFPARSYVYREPYGQVLILSPWSYPFQLAVLPTIGAIAGGNAFFLRSSSKSAATSALIEQLIESTVTHEIGCVIPADESKDGIFDVRYDMIFFTGSPKTGRKIMSEAAKHLTPVILELGGKSPCYIAENANIKISAKRIAWGKLMNAGQTCVAPDYIIVDEQVEEEFLCELCSALDEMYNDLLSSGELVGAINDQEFERLKKLVIGKNLVCGGNFIDGDRRMEPVVIRDLDLDDPLLNEEIFGPIFPVVSVSGEDEAVDFIRSKEKPLACYIFSEDRKQIQSLVSRLSFGGGCVNDTMMHVANGRLPFGGVGNSGMGSYHGKASYEAFTRRKSVVWNTTIIDVPIKYPPHGDKKLSLIRKLM